jgi:hypothetical protein
MKILAVSKTVFEQMMKDKGITPSNVEQQDKIVFISLNNNLECSLPGDEPFFPESKKNVKVMYFADVDKDEYVSLLDGSKRKVLARAFTPTQAEELFGFIRDTVRKGRIETVLIHCTMGVARSGAVASFIHDYLRGDWETFKRHNPQIQPNAHVYRLLQEACVNSQEFKLELLNPRTPEEMIADFNDRHPEQYTSIHELTKEQVEKMYPGMKVEKVKDSGPSRYEERFEDGRVVVGGSNSGVSLVEKK